MRREKDIVGPEQGGTLRDLGVSLPPGVQAHRKDEMLHKLNQLLKAWESEAGDDAAGLALPEDNQREKIQAIRGRAVPLIEDHELAHSEDLKAEDGYRSLLREIGDLEDFLSNPPSNIDSVFEGIGVKIRELAVVMKELAKTKKAVKKTDSKLPFWLQQPHKHVTIPVPKRHPAR